MAVPVIIIGGQTIIGFDHARLEQVLSATQAMERPTFGASVADAGKIAARANGGVFGAYVGKVRPGSVAERAGLVPGDIITEMNKQRIASADDLQNALSRLDRGSRFSLVVLRGNSTFVIEGTL